MVVKSFLQPFFLFEEPQNGCGRDNHQCDGDRISEFIVQFGHNVKVHPVDTDSKRECSPTPWISMYLPKIVIQHFEAKHRNIACV